jgi:hypothetical protein
VEGATWILDASLSYRLLKRWGPITLEGRNLPDQRFGFHATAFGKHAFYPERLVLLRFTLAF